MKSWISSISCNGKIRLEWWVHLFVICFWDECHWWDYCQSQATIWFKTKRELKINLLCKIFSFFDCYLFLIFKLNNYPRSLNFALYWSGLAWIVWKSHECPVQQTKRRGNIYVRCNSCIDKLIYFAILPHEQSVSYKDMNPVNRFYLSVKPDMDMENCTKKSGCIKQSEQCE